MQRLVRDWPNFNHLETLLGKLSPPDFITCSDDFRHRDHHRIPANIEVGYAPGARVFLKDGKVTFSNTTLSPIKVIDVLPPLKAQYQAACACMEGFWSVVTAMEANWKNKSPSLD